MQRFGLFPLLVGLALAFSAPAARAGEPRLGSKRTIWESKGFKADEKKVMALGDTYREFLSANKTEREVVAAAIALATKKGFVALDPSKPPAKVSPGDRFYYDVHGKTLALMVVGKRPVSEGLRIVGAHIDSVRLDAKQRPLFEDGNIALFETHYYGGIKAYQWLSIPLALHGVVVKKDGKRVNVLLGEDPSDPVLVIPDLLAHLSHVTDKTEGEEVPKEKLDVMMASRPAAKGGVRATVLEWLRRSYGIDEEDLESAELQLVPAGPARDVGVDRSMIGGYGQDDRACGFAALHAILELGTPEHTAMTLLVDKEEVGSTGVTGMDSVFLQTVTSTLLRASMGDGVTDHIMRTTFTRSMVLSADVTLAADPLYPELYDTKNVPFLGSGPAMDATGFDTELVAHVRAVLRKAGAIYQTGEFGKVRYSKSDYGTMLPYITREGMPGMNLSIPLLSMHAPFEVISKVDLFHAARAYGAFLTD